MLEQNHNISAATLDSQLTIIQGSVSDLAAIKETLAPNGVPASLIVSGLGAAPKITWKHGIPNLAMDQPTICGDASVLVLNALRELRRDGVISETQKPTIILFSTTGISKQRDVPYALMPLYHVGLKTAHIDKRIQERNFAAASMESGADAPMDSFVFVRPTLLFDGPSKGLWAVKSGWSKYDDAPHAASGEASGPAMGYSIHRTDVGLWVYEKVVKDVGEWKGKCASLTY